MVGKWWFKQFEQIKKQTLISFRLMGLDPFYFDGLVQWNIQFFVWHCGIYSNIAIFTVKHGYGSYVCHHKWWYINQLFFGTRFLVISFYFGGQQHCWTWDFGAFSPAKIRNVKRSNRGTINTSCHGGEIHQESCFDECCHKPITTTLSTSWESFALTCMHIHVYGLSMVILIFPI